MIQTVERRILHIVDDIENLNSTQMAIVPRLVGSPATLEDFYDGGFGVKTDTDNYRFSKFNDIHYTKSVYMTNDNRAVIIGGAFFDTLGSGTYTGDISPDSVNIGRFAGLVDLNGGLDGYNVYIGTGSGSQSKAPAYDIAIGFESGRLSDCSGGSGGYTCNVFLGYRSGFEAIGYDNVNIGRRSGVNSIGDRNINIGAEAGLNSDRSYCTAIGDNAGTSSEGDESIYIGHYSGHGVHGSNNTGIGSFALYNVGSPSFQDSTAIGYYAGYYSVGNGSFFGGYRSGHSSTGPYNVCIGYDAGYTLAGSGYNVCMGYRAGNSSLSSSTNNIVIGRDAGSGLAGSDNVLIGRNSKAFGTMNSIIYNINNVLSIFSGEYSGSQSPLIAGDFSTGRVNIQRTLNLTPNLSQPSPAYEGDIIYNADINIPQYYNGSAWVDMGGSGGSTFIGLSDVYNTLVPSTYTGIDYRLAVVSPTAGGIGSPGIMFPQSIYVNDNNIWIRNAYFEYRDGDNTSLLALEVRSVSEDNVGDSYIHGYENASGDGGNLHLEVDYTTYFDSYNTQSQDTSTGTHSWGYLGGVSRLETMKLVNVDNEEYGFVAPTLTIAGIDAAVDEVLVTKEWVTSKIKLSSPASQNYINVSDGVGGWLDTGVTLEVVSFNKTIDFKTAHGYLKASGSLVMSINSDATATTDRFEVRDNGNPILTLKGIGGSDYGAMSLPLSDRSRINALGVKSVVTKEYADFLFAEVTPSSNITLDYYTSDFVSIPMTSINSGTITTINNMTVGQGIIVYVDKTTIGGTGLIFNVNGLPIVVLGPSVTGKYSFVISKVATNTYILSKPAESLGLA